MVYCLDLINDLKFILQEYDENYAEISSSSNFTGKKLNEAARRIIFTSIHYNH